MVDEIFIKEFKNNFNGIKNIPIVLYGIGQYTELILKNIVDFNFVGLMDSKTTGNTIYDLKVLDDNEVIESARAIIIVSNLSVSKIIYNRIKHLKEENRLHIYYLNGLEPVTYDESISQNNYWNESIKELKLKIEKNDIISFDIFDTLIMRTCLEPTVIFDIIESYLRIEKNVQCDFKNKRIEAEKICYRTINKYFDLDLIYRQLQILLDLPDELIEEIKNKELEIEYKHIFPRYDIIETLNYANEIGKKVILTSDMYLNKSILVPLLEKCSINNYKNLFISCDVKKDKYNGQIWNKIRGIYPNGRILHIGDNLHSDIELPMKFGIHTFEIKKAIDILKISGIDKFIEKPKSLEDYILLGMFSTKALNSPFSLHYNKGKLYVENMFDFGYLFFGPVVFKYIIWLINKIKEEKIDIVLFPARDGYILEKIYNNVASKLKIKLPKGIYFLTSRRASSVSAINNEDDIIFIINNMCNVASITIKDILNNAFGIYIKDSDALLKKNVYEVGKQYVINYIISNYKTQILNNAEEERKGYLNYIKSLELDEYKNIGFVNFVGRGITQKFITTIIGKELNGLYFATEVDILQYYDSLDNVFACYGNCLSTHTSKLNLLSKYLFGEIIFSAPQEQLLKFDDLGKPVYLEESDRDFSGIQESHMGIIQYIKDAFSILELDNISLEQLFELESRLSNKFVDDIFGIFFSEFCVASDNVKQNLKFYDPYQDINGTNLLS